MESSDGKGSGGDDGTSGSTLRIRSAVTGRGVPDSFNNSGERSIVDALIEADPTREFEFVTSLSPPSEQPSVEKLLLSMAQSFAVV